MKIPNRLSFIHDGTYWMNGLDHYFFIRKEPLMLRQFGQKGRQCLQLIVVLLLHHISELFGFSVFHNESLITWFCLCCMMEAVK